MYQVDAKKLQRIARQYYLDLIVLFGSQAKGQAQSGSDLDVAVRWTKRSRRGIARELALVGELVDAIRGDGDLDVVFLNGASPMLLFEVARSGIVLYERRPGDFMQFQSYAARRYDDNTKFFKLQEAYLKKRYG
jgi:predicted nucleotidyltransferase